MNAAPLLVTGMVRSGTSVLSRAIDAHPQMACALDPCMGVLRAFNNALLRNSTADEVDPDAPLTDFFFEDWPSIALYEDATMSIPLEQSLHQLRADAAGFAQGNSPALCRSLDRLEGSTYAEVLAAFLELIAETYSVDGTPRVVGFKQTWVEALAAPFLRSFPAATCVHIVRDPRAVIGSWKKTDHLSHGYPFLMMIRHWRKSVALASRWSKRFPGAYLVVRYEDFVRDPEESLTSIAELLGEAYDAGMLDASRFTDGDGCAWQSNTSYESEGDGVTMAYVDRWRDRLSPDEVALVEELCGPEMKWLGIDRETEAGRLMDLVGPLRAKLEPRRDSDAPGRRDDPYAMTARNELLEIARWLLVRGARDYVDQVPQDRLEPIVLDADILGGRPRFLDHPRVPDGSD